MPHVRKQIRDEVATVLGSLTTTSTRVTTSRPSEGRPLTVLPALVIVTGEEEVDHEHDTNDGTTRKESRALEVIVSGYVAETAAMTVDDQLDLIASEVEVAMSADETLSGLVISSFYMGMQVEFDQEAEKPYGLIIITYGVLYRVSNTDPDTALT